MLVRRQQSPFWAIFANLDLALVSNMAGVSCRSRLFRGRFLHPDTELSDILGRGGPGVVWRCRPRRAKPVGQILILIQGLRPHCVSSVLFSGGTTR